MQPPTKKMTMTKQEEIKIGQLPIHRGKTYILRVLSIYNDLFRYKYGFAPQVNIGRFGKEIILDRTEIQISALMIIFFDWAGMSGESDFDRSKLVTATHPFAWFFSTMNQYEAYARNVLKLDFDNEEEVRNFVGENITKLS